CLATLRTLARHGVHTRIVEFHLDRAQTMRFTSRIRRPKSRLYRQTASNGIGRRLRIEGLEERRVLSATTAPELLFDVNPVSTEPDTGFAGTYSSEPSLLGSVDGEVYFTTSGDTVFSGSVQDGPDWQAGGLW